MRLNKYLALSTGLSRRAADQEITKGNVTINDQPVQVGQAVNEADIVKLKGEAVQPIRHRTIMLHKPAGYVVSRDGQGARTIYDILPAEYHDLKPIGRLDKDSSGLLLLTNDGDLAQQLSHPSQRKIKQYELKLDKSLQPLHRQMIAEYGLQLSDGPSKLRLERLIDGDDKHWRVIMHEGRNRQIRRTFASLGYLVSKLHRTHFGTYALGDLEAGSFKPLDFS